MTRNRFRPTRWLLLAGLVSAAVLIAVHMLQAMGWAPCELCLHEREVFWTALAVAAIGLALARWRPAAAVVACCALAAVFAAGAGLGTYHAGVEWRWWAGPTACTALRSGGAVSAADIDAVFSGARKLHVVRCDEAAFRILGVSLAGWNALLSAALAVLSLGAAASRRRSRP